MKYIFIFFILFLSIVVNATGYKYPKNSEPHAKVKLGYGDVKKEVQPVFLYEVDGFDVGMGGNYIRMTPGKHIIKCKSQFDLNEYTHKIPKGQSFENTVENNTLEIEVENGKIYYLGFSIKDKDIKKWKPVIFKVQSRVK